MPEPATRQTANNAAPNGRDATNQIVLSWSDSRHGLNHEEELFRTSLDGGKTWSESRAAQQDGDRPDFPAIAISPDGKNVYVTYDAFLAPWRSWRYGMMCATPRCAAR